MLSSSIQRLFIKYQNCSLDYGIMNKYKKNLEFNFKSLKDYITDIKVTMNLLFLFPIMNGISSNKYLYLLEFFDKLLFLRIFAFCCCRYHFKFLPFIHGLKKSTKFTRNSTQKPFFACDRTKMDPFYLQ